MADPSRGEFELLVAMINQGFDGIHARLDKLNGKTSIHADRITTLEAKTGRVDVVTIIAVLGLIISGIAAYASIH